MLVRGLWGMQIEPEADQTLRVSASFKITMASIYQFNGINRTSVYVTFQESTFLLCSLIPEKVEQQVVDITCLQGENITFRVEGPNVIHLLGNYVSQTGIDDLSDEEIEYVQIEGSDEHDLDDAQSVGFYKSKKISFDESDDFGSSSDSQSEAESETESESEPKKHKEYNYSHLTDYLAESTSNRSSPFGGEDVDNQNPAITMESKGKYVLFNNNTSDNDTVYKHPSPAPENAERQPLVTGPTASLELEAMKQPAASELISPLEAKNMIVSESQEQTTQEDAKKPNKSAKKQKKLASKKKKKKKQQQQQQSEKKKLINDGETELINPPTEDSTQNSKGLPKVKTESSLPQPISRNPKRAARIDSMEKLALFAQEDAKSAMDTRKERSKKKSHKTDHVITKKARLSAE